MNEKIIKTTDSAENEFHLPSGKITYILSFIIPMVVLIAIYASRKIYPFFNGDNCYLRSDMYHQYLPFYTELWSKLRNGGSLAYSWNIGLGINFTALYAYYLSCPLNWFIFLFPHDSLIEVMSALIILKLSLASLSTTWFLSKKTGSSNILISVFGMFYALSGFIAAYCWNIMWLDCIVFMPLILLGLTKLVEEDKCFLYCLTLGLTILSNYYISLMICMTLVCYFVVLIVSLPKTTFKAYTKKCINFAVFSLLAGGLAAVLLLPELYALSYTVSSKFSFPKTLENYFPIMEILVRHLSNVEVHTGLDHYPNIYCGVGIFLLFPLYIMNDRIPIREKFSKCLLLLVFYTAFNLNIPNFIWHGFHFPNSLPCRQSFIYCLIVLSMCYDAFKDMRHYTKKQLTTAGFIAIGFLLIAEQIFFDSKYDFKVFYISGAFILFYMLLMYLYHTKKVIVPVFIFLFFLSTILECALNLEATGFSTTGRSYYFSDNESMNAILEYMKKDDPTFYRMEKHSGYRSKNDNAWHNYHGVSYFSSTASGGVTDFFKFMGCENSTNAYGYNGSTYLTSSMFSVKYIISEKELVENKLMSYYYSNDNRYAYKLNYTLPLGFMVPNTLEDDWDTNSSNPFLVQNSFLTVAAKNSDVFKQIALGNTSNSSAQICVDKTEQVYVYVLSGTKKVNVYIDDVSKSYDINHNRIIDVGVINPDQDVRVTSDDTNATMSVVAYTIDEDEFINAFNELNDESLQISTFKDTYIKGEITVNRGGMLFTSIPYDKGWTVKVDGNKVPINKIKNAFVGVDVNVGTHTIEFSYTAEGHNLGMAITFICVIILIAIYLATDDRYEKLMKKLSKTRRK